MCGFVDPFAEYERRVDQEYLENLGFDTEEEYRKWIQQEKELDIRKDLET